MLTYQFESKNIKIRWKYTINLIHFELGLIVWNSKRPQDIFHLKHRNKKFILNRQSMPSRLKTLIIMHLTVNCKKSFLFWFKGNYLVSVFNFSAFSSRGSNMGSGSWLLCPSCLPSLQGAAFDIQGSFWPKAGYTKPRKKWDSARNVIEN